MEHRKKTENYCKVCRHRVYDLDKHVETEEHRRLLGREGQPYKTNPRTPKPRRVELVR